MTDLLDRMSTWVAGLAWDDVPAEVTDRTRDAVRDALAVAAGGATLPAARIARAYAATAPGDAPVVGAKAGAHPALAAFANGVSGSALDFEDGHYLAGAIHPAGVTAAALLAASTPGTTVREFVLAQVAGVEIGLRAAARLWPKHEGDHYHATGTAGAIGAAVAVAKLRGYDADGVSRAIRAAWLHAPMSTFGMPMANESIGWAAHTGIVAADLVAAGWMSEPPAGAVTEHALHPASPFQEAGAADDPFLTSIGEVWETSNTYFKFHAACRYTHAAAWGFGQLLERHGLAAADVAGVVVGTHGSATFLDNPAPHTVDHAQYSFPFVLANVALHGAVGAPEMAQESLGEPVRLELASRITLEHAPDLDHLYPVRYPSRVTVTTTSGAVHAGDFADAPGDPGTPFGAAELRAKWLRLLAGAGLAPGEATALLDALGDPAAPVLATLAPLLADR